MSKELIHQMAIKAMYDTVGADGLVPTLLVFRAYPRIKCDLPLSKTTKIRVQTL